MFCTNCGFNFSNDEGGFCPKCGASKTSHVVAQVAISTSIKTFMAKQKWLLLGLIILAVIAVVITVNVFGAHPLVGTWEVNRGGGYFERWIFNRDGSGRSYERWANGFIDDEMIFNWSADSNSREGMVDLHVLFFEGRVVDDVYQMHYEVSGSILVVDGWQRLNRRN